MRLGGKVYLREDDPEQYALKHIQKGFRAAYCPDGLTAGDSEKIRAYREAFRRYDIVLAEVGAWCNPLSSDSVEAQKSVGYMEERLALADALGAVTCVNVLGSAGSRNWFGADRNNYSDDFFALAVDRAREIVDAVRPKTAKLSFEMMPYCFLDSAEEYLRFLKAVDRDQVGVHFDPVNCIASPRIYYQNGAMVEHTISVLGKRIVSIHLKDLLLDPEAAVVSFLEVPLGEGGLDLSSFLRAVGRLGVDVPVMLEHLPDEESYDRAAGIVRKELEQIR